MTHPHRAPDFATVGDHQVSEFALQVEARTIAAPGHVPYGAAGREFGGEHGFGITPIAKYPYKHSAFFLDSRANMSSTSLRTRPTCRGSWALA